MPTQKRKSKTDSEATVATPLKATNDDGDMVSTDDGIIKKKIKSSSSSPSSSSNKLDEYPKDEKNQLKEMLRLYLAGVNKSFKIETKTTSVDDDDDDDTSKDASEKGHKKATLLSKLEAAGLIKVTETTTVKSYNLTDAAVNDLTPDGYNLTKDDFTTNEDLRQHVVKFAYHSETAERIWIELEQHGRQGVAKKDLVANLGIAGGTSNPNFFYSLEGLKSRGYVQEGSKSKLVRLVTDTAFIDPPPQFKRSNKKNKKAKTSNQEEEEVVEETTGEETAEDQDISADNGKVEEEEYEMAEDGEGNALHAEF
jgi:hypothetical protein